MCIGAGISHVIFDIADLFALVLARHFGCKFCVATNGFECFFTRFFVYCKPHLSLFLSQAGCIYGIFLAGNVVLGQMTIFFK